MSTQAQAGCVMVPREYPPGSGNSVAWCTVHQCVHGGVAAPAGTGTGCVQAETPWGWLYAVPLPYYGLRTVRCGSCGARYKGRLRNRAYEAHWLLAHSPLQALLVSVREREQPAWRQHYDSDELRTLQDDTSRCTRELLRVVAILRAVAAHG